MRFSRLFFVVVIAAAGVFCYMNSLGGQFVWDDYAFVYLNPALHSLEGFFDVFMTKESIAPFSPNQQAALFRPLTTLSLALDYQYWGADTFGYHLNNMLIHIACGILVFLLVEAIMRRRWLALFAALVFMAHPAQTESVTWICERSNLLCFFFYLGSLYTYVLWRARPGRKHLYMLSLAAFITALLSKEAAVSLPFVLVAYDLIMGKVNRTNIGGVFAWSPYMASFIPFFYGRQAVLGAAVHRSMFEGSFWRPLIVVPRNLLALARLSVFPTGLCADREDVLVSSGLNWLPDPGVYAGAFLIAVSLLLFIFFLKKKKETAFFMAYFFISVSPYLFLAYPVDRALYFPIFAAGVTAGSLFSGIVKNRGVRFAAAAAVVITFCSMTIIRNNDWKDELTFYRSCIRECPLNARAQLNVGVAYSNLYPGMYPAEEERAYRIAQSLAPEFADAFYNLAKLYNATGCYDAAEKQAREGLSLYPDNPFIREQLAFTMLAKGDADTAEKLFREIIVGTPLYLNVYLNFAEFLISQRRFEDAREMLKEMIDSTQFDQFRAYGWLKIGKVYTVSGRAREAVAVYRYVMGRFPREEIACAAAQASLQYIVDGNREQAAWQSGPSGGGE